MDGDMQFSEYHKSGLLHIGSSYITNNNTISKNWCGSYLGPHNPLTTSGHFSYAVPPGNWNDYYAFKHDQGYDKLGAAGIFDALLNPITIQEDSLFAQRMLTNPQSSSSFWGIASGYAFSEISSLKLSMIVLQMQLLTPIH